MTRIFQFGGNVLQVIGEGNRWMIVVNGVRLRGFHPSAAEAWTAGVEEAERLSRPGPAETPLEAVAP